jgi:hypothetical protein
MVMLPHSGYRTFRFHMEGVTGNWNGLDGLVGGWGGTRRIIPIPRPVREG